MFGLFGKNSKALQLIRDSQSIIRSDETAYADRHLSKISEITSSSIQQALSKPDIKTTKWDKTPRWLKEAHRDARKRNDQAALKWYDFGDYLFKSPGTGRSRPTGVRCN